MTAFGLWRWGVAFVILGALVWQAMQYAPHDWPALALPLPGPLIVAAVLGTCSYVAFATAWAKLRNQGEDWIAAGGPWFASLLARYAPGGIWQAAVRVAASHSVGESKRESVHRYLVEQGLACGSTALLALALSLFAPVMEPVLIIYPALILVACAALLLMVRELRRAPTIAAPVPAVLWIMVAHVLMASGFVALVAAWAPFQTATALLIARALLIAGLAGVLAVFVPAGLGVRELVLVWLLAPALPVGVAVAIAVIARVWLLVCELAAWALHAALLRRRLRWE